ncbi:MAG: hypothetical protein IT558_01960 [Alphaproteobacteria bacterium]|nr:hypothetical protein [Alphaproteobacteria bacterium]
MSDEQDDNLGLGEESFDNFEKKKGTLGQLWNESPPFKIGVVVVAAIAIFGTIILFSGKEEKPEPSYVPEAADVSAPPGTEEATPAYVEAIQEENEARTETAIREGTSSLPTPISPPVGRLAVAEGDKEDEDPLQRWRRLQEERLQQEMLRAQNVAPEDVQNNQARAETIQAMADMMAQQMQSILESKNQIKTGYRTITDMNWLKEYRASQEKELAATVSTPNENYDKFGPQEILYPAGEIAYAFTLTEANSDVPGPVLAQIVSGPLSGNRVLGSFQKHDEFLTLDFDVVVVDGVSYNIDGVALDPETTLPALATDVDHHYLKRVILPMAAAFIEGAANAISETGRTDITIQGESVAQSTQEANDEQKISSGIQEAGQELRTILDDIQGDIETTIRIETGTPIGILFLEPVVRSESNRQLTTAEKREQNAQNQLLGLQTMQQQQNLQGYFGNGIPGFSALGGTPAAGTTGAIGTVGGTPAPATAGNTGTGSANAR